MIGISVYLNENRREHYAQWIQKASSYGLSSIFTSLHIPEDDPKAYKALLQELGALAKQFNMELLADVSPTSLEHLGLKWETLDTLLDWGLTGIRVDYGFSAYEIVHLSKIIKVGINASTLLEHELDDWIEKGLNVANVEAWHNFYPRPETGLDQSFLIERNRFLKAKGITTMAFIPGDQDLRGPIHAGLPTLEKHRFSSPVLAAAELMFSAYTDKVLIGDHDCKYETLECLSYLSKGIIPLRMKLFQKNLSTSILRQVHTNRKDPARDVIRSVESRSYAQMGDISIAPAHQVERIMGMVTIDNQLYGRYAGELQIVLKDLPKDEKVNVIGQILEEDLPLLKEIKAGGKFQLIVRD